ncbi:MAG: sodium-dependent transporter, partial [Acidobacteriota bacterium]
TVSNWFLPVGGLLVAVFAGWIIKPSVFEDELELGHGPFKLFQVALFCLRFIGPIAICWILWAVIGGRSFA